MSFRSAPLALRPLSRRQPRGSALITVLLFTFLLLTLAVSILQWAGSERRLNQRNVYWIEARNAAEAVAEYGCYQVAQAFNTKMNPTFGSTGTNPISFPSSLASSFFAGGHVTASSIEVNAGTVTKIPSNSYYFVDPLDPNNKYDPLVGRYVQRRDVTVLSKVTVTPPAGGAPVTAYIQEKVSVRGASLLAYAIFYSGNDLEVNPQPQMDIYGPVHVNGNMFIGSVGSSATSFHGPVSMSGNIFHAWRGTTTTAQEGGSGMSATNAVNFATDNTGNNLANMLVSSVWKDSTMGADSATSGLSSLVALVTPARTASFAQYASQTWKGNLQTAAMGIQSYNPMGYSEVVGHDSLANVDILATDDTADDGANVGTGTGFGHGYGPHALIEPAMALALSTDTYKSAKDSIEEQKFARKAGLYVKLVIDSNGNPTSDAFGIMTPALFGDPHSAPVGTAAANIGPNGGLRLGTVPSNVFTYIKYVSAGSGSSTTVTSGMYDKHQGKGINLLQINMVALKTALTDMAAASPTTGVAGTDVLKADNVTKWGLGTGNGFDTYVTDSTGYNGGIYVEVSYSPSAPTTTLTAVLLANGTVASGSSLVPSVNGVTGFTLATNAPVYILGNFNADGTIETGSTTSALWPDDYPGTAVTASKESPVAIAGDAVTILSPNYFGTGGATNKVAPLTQSSGSAYNSYSTTSPTASLDAEIAAALISGSNETSPSSTGTQQYSGGVHNMPRFLENWSGRTVAIRGSLVSMYNTRVATAAWASSYYSPPNRQWGFDQLFANGIYPPIIPVVITYRRVDFNYVKNAADYAAQISTL